MRPHPEQKEGEEELLNSAPGRYVYAKKTARLADELWDYVLFHPIKWWKAHREVQRRLRVQAHAMEEAEI